jgi:PIN domain nuclease of toxin-antitoxin system
VNLLLDTHTFLWVSGRQQFVLLPQAAKEVLEDGANMLWLSLASVWELSIKVSTGKLQLKEPVTDLVQFQQNQSGIRLLPITLAHLELIETLPFHHKDPFDRLLIAQIQTENLAIVSIDAAFDSYGVKRLWLT